MTPNRRTLTLPLEKQDAAANKITESIQLFSIPKEIYSPTTVRNFGLEGHVDDYGRFKPFPLPRLHILEPKIKQVFWCRFTDTIHPELGKQRPVVIISPINVLGGTSVVIPLSTSEENYHDPDTVMLSENPNPNSIHNCWAIPHHVSTVSHWRLLRFKDKTSKALTTPKVTQRDFDALIAKMQERLPKMSLTAN